MLVVSWGSGVHGFTLDTTLGEFVLTHPHIRIPQRGALMLCLNLSFVHCCNYDGV